MEDVQKNTEGRVSLPALPSYPQLSSPLLHQKQPPVSCQDSSWQTFSVKDQIVNLFSSLHQYCSVPLLQHESSQRQYVNEWQWLDANKALLTQTARARFGPWVVAYWPLLCISTVQQNFCTILETLSGDSFLIKQPLATCAVEHWKCGWCNEDSTFKFYPILLHLNVNSHMWPMATVLDRIVIQTCSVNIQQEGRFMFPGLTKWQHLLKAVPYFGVVFPLSQKNIS